MSRLFIHTATVKRMQAVGTNGRHEQTEVASGVKCLFAPMASRAEIENAFQVGTGYDVYLNDSGTDIQTGDQLVWDGATFNVRGVREYAVPGIAHRHVLAVREGV